MPAGFNILNQLLRFSFRLVRQTEVKGKHIGSLGFVFHFARVEIFLSVLLNGELVQLFKIAHILTDQLAHLNKEPVGIGKIRGSDQILVRKAAGCFVTGIQGQPVTKMIRMQVKQTPLRAVFLHKEDPLLHRVELIADHLGIAISSVHPVRNHHRCIAPGRGSVGLPASVVGADIRNCAVGSLVTSQIMEPLFEEFLGLICNGCGSGEHLGIARPASSFVTLGAVQRNIDKIAPMSPHNIFVKLLHKGIRTFKISRSLHIREHHNSLKLRGINFFPEEAFQSDIAEPMECKVGFIHPLLSIGCNTDLRLGITEVRSVEIAFFIQNFRVRNRKLSTSPLRHYPLHITGNVLTEINHRFALGGCKDLHCVQAHHLPGHFAFRWDQNFFIYIVQLSNGENLVRSSSKINGFAVIDVGIQDMALAAFPASIRRNQGSCSVLILNFQCRNQSSFFIGNALIVFVGAAMEPPAIGQGDF